MNLTLLDLQKKAKETSLYAAIEYTKGLYPRYPQMPKKPILEKNHSVEDAELYVKDFKFYTKSMEKYRKEKDEYQKGVSDIDDLIIQFIKDEAGFERLPDEKVKSKVWNLAWSDAHSNGYFAVCQKLEELVDLFE